MASALKLLRGGSSWTLAHWRQDLSASVVSAALTLPQAIVFAKLAGLPPSMGLWTAILPLLLCALLGGTAQILTGPVVSVGLAMVSTLQVFAFPGSSAYIADVAIVSFGAGLIQVLLAATSSVRVLEWMEEWGAQSISVAVGVSLLLSQLPYATGLTAASQAPWSQALSCLLAWRSVHGADVLVFVFSVVLGVALSYAPWAVLRQYRLSWMLLVATGLSWALGLSVARVGWSVPQAPWTGGLHLDAQARAFLPQWLGLMLNLAVLGLMQTVLLAHSLRLRGAAEVHLSREAAVQGLVNMATACLGCYVSAASFNRSVTHERLGARTSWSLVGTGLGVAAGAVLLPWLIAQIPYAAMAGMLALTAWAMLETRALRKDFFTVAASLSTVAAGVFIGLGAAVLLAFILSISRHLARGAASVSAQTV